MTDLISWRQRAGPLFDCEKMPATARREMISGPSAPPNLARWNAAG
ncbi:hypothetical protein [Bradyrhizobium liaoningense]|nr:hypothetical protein [Bradyrhizobium liaoningense]MBR0903365.1 hypothetical protein [Bradyrhizobium liaoningense]